MQKLQSFVKLDALYKDVAFTDGSVKIPETKIIYDFVKDAAGNGPAPDQSPSRTLKQPA